LILYAVFHATVAAFAVLMQLGNGKSAWKYVWIIPILYLLVAGMEALIAGSITGLMYVFIVSCFLPGAMLIVLDSIGFVYNSGYFRMSTWIPFVWAWINVLVLVVSSFSVQLGL
jgi:hypothetical protein